MRSAWPPSRRRSRRCAQGRPVLVTDSEDRENEGDVVLAAADAHRRVDGLDDPPHQRLPLRARAPTPSPTGSACRSWSPTTATRCARPTRSRSTPPQGVTTGISAADRSRTVRLLADPAATADDLVRPGHVVPLRAREGGVLARPGHTEAAVDLCRLAGLPPVGAIAELVNDDGTMMRLPEVLGHRRRARPARHHHRPARRVAPAPRPRPAASPRRRCRRGTASSRRSASATP